MIPFKAPPLPLIPTCPTFREAAKNPEEDNAAVEMYLQCCTSESYADRAAVDLLDQVGGDEDRVGIYAKTSRGSTSEHVECGHMAEHVIKCGFVLHLIRQLL